MTFGVVNCRFDPRLGDIRIALNMKMDAKELRIGAQTVDGRRLASSTARIYFKEFQGVLFMDLGFELPVNTADLNNRFTEVLRSRCERKLRTVLYSSIENTTFGNRLLNQSEYKYSSNFEIYEDQQGNYIVERSKVFPVGQIVNISEMVNSMGTTLNN